LALVGCVACVRVVVGCCGGVSVLAAVIDDDGDVGGVESAAGETHSACTGLATRLY
jgi:hypothetical protein